MCFFSKYEVIVYYFCRPFNPIVVYRKLRIGIACVYSAASPEMGVGCGVFQRFQLFGLSII
jgi:hypothetical protein